MPLAFESRSHGSIAFGFFNIQTDMLLLDELFFFAEKWCGAVIELARLARSTDKKITSIFPGWCIPDRRAIGDLHGAIAGIDHSGFIGETYRAWPFPQRRADFKQQPEGLETQHDVEAMIVPLGKRLDITMRWDQTQSVISIYDYQFRSPQFAELIAYVDRGGFPRWRNDERPLYVVEMVDALRRLRSSWTERLEAG